jgi:hypothetical protein
MDTKDENEKEFVGYSNDSSRLACFIPPIRFLWVWVLNAFIICSAPNA